MKFKPGTTEWENDAAAEIKQVSDTLIEFKLKEGLKFTGDYGPLTAEDVKFSFERFLPGPDGTKVDYADDWAALDKVEVTGPLTGKIHLKSPSPAVWLIALADGSGVIISKKAFESLGDKFKTTPIGSGPYHAQGIGPARPFHAGRQPRLSGREAVLHRDRRQADHRRQDGPAGPAGGRDRLFPHRPGRRQGDRQRARHQGQKAVGDRLCVDRPQHREEAVGRCEGPAGGRARRWTSRRSSRPPITARSSRPMRWRRRASSAIGRTRPSMSATSRAPRRCSRKPGRAAASPPSSPCSTMRWRRRQPPSCKPTSRRSASTCRSTRSTKAPTGPMARTTPARTWSSCWSSIGASSIPGSRRSGSPRTRSEPGTGSAGTARSSTPCTSRGSWKRIKAKREQIYIDAQKLMDEVRRLLVDHAQRLHLRLQGHAVAGHPAQWQPMAIRLVQAGLSLAVQQTGARRSAGPRCHRPDRTSMR